MELYLGSVTAQAVAGSGVALCDVLCHCRAGRQLQCKSVVAYVCGTDVIDVVEYAVGIFHLLLVRCYICLSVTLQSRIALYACMCLGSVVRGGVHFCLKCLQNISLICNLSMHTVRCRLAV